MGAPMYLGVRLVRGSDRRVRILEGNDPTNSGGPGRWWVLATTAIATPEGVLAIYNDLFNERAQDLLSTLDEERAGLRKEMPGAEDEDIQSWAEELWADRLDAFDALAALHRTLPCTQAEVDALPLEIIGGYVTLWCETSAELRDDHGPFTQCPKPETVGQRVWHIVAVREEALRGVLLGELIAQEQAQLLAGPLTFVEAWNQLHDYAGSLVEPAEEHPNLWDITFVEFVER